MSNKIIISVEDLEREAAVLDRLAEELTAEISDYRKNVDSMRNSVCGIAEPITAVLSNEIQGKKCAEEIQFGADIARQCASAFRNADINSAKDVKNMNDQIIATGGEEYSNQADSSSSQKIGDVHSYVAYDGKTYNVVSNFDPDFVLDQHGDIFENNAAGDASCNVTIIRYLRGLKNGERWEDEQAWYEYCLQRGVETDGWVSDWGKMGMKRLEETSGTSVEQKRQTIYNYLMKGIAVGAYVNPNSSSGYPGHMVAVVGIREGADPNNLQDSDFLVMDPATGKICALTGNDKNSKCNNYFLTQRGTMKIAA